jgi:hypothetical protein
MSQCSSLFLSSSRNTSWCARIAGICSKEMKMSIKCTQSLLTTYCFKKTRHGTHYNWETDNYAVYNQENVIASDYSKDQVWDVKIMLQWILKKRLWKRELKWLHSRVPLQAFVMTMMKISVPH